MTKYVKIIRERFNSLDYPVFTLSDMRVVLGKEGITQRYLKELVSRLIRAKEIHRINKGTYTFYDDTAVVGFAYRPFYYGLEDALSYRNFWTQATNPIVITPNRVREGQRKFGNANYLVRRIKPKLFFGFSFVNHYGFWLPVSDPEKTLIDLVYYRHGVRADAIESLTKAIDRKRLEEYMKKYSKRLRKNVYAQLRATSLVKGIQKESE
ncbi:MAG: hypothetical protein ABSD68_02845 [Candidatus Micrarchaeales archaeon]|jgi:predicted transcriptional regulator of viral defense system